MTTDPYRLAVANESMAGIAGRVAEACGGEDCTEVAAALAWMLAAVFKQMSAESRGEALDSLLAAIRASVPRDG